VVQGGTSTAPHHICLTNKYMIERIKKDFPGIKIKNYTDRLGCLITLGEKSSFFDEVLLHYRPIYESRVVGLEIEECNCCGHSREVPKKESFEIVSIEHLTQEQKDEQYKVVKELLNLLNQ